MTLLFQVRKQHLERNLEFLCNELSVADKREGNERVFFVSAREAMVSRLNQDKGTPTPSKENGVQHTK